MDKKRLIVVLGMHRSGTSAITRGLRVMGVDLGDALLAPAAGINDKGFWEDFHLLSLNAEILAAVGRDWYHLKPITREEVADLRQRGYMDRALELLRQRVGDAAVFGFKDPRVAMLLPFWQEVFDVCRIDVGYVLAMRHPLSVADSLAKRNGLSACP